MFLTGMDKKWAGGGNKNPNAQSSKSKQFSIFSVQSNSNDQMIKLNYIIWDLGFDWSLVIGAWDLRNLAYARDYWKSDFPRKSDFLRLVWDFGFKILGFV